MVHLSRGMKAPGLAAPAAPSRAIIAGMAQATLPDTPTPWEDYVEDYDRIRDTMAQVLDGFEDFNRRVRLPLRLPASGSRPASCVFLTPSGRAEFSSAAAARRRSRRRDGSMLETMRSHDQWNTTIYSDDDRYRGVKNLRTLIFMNEDDMRERGIDEFDLVDITSIAKDGSTPLAVRLPGDRATTSRAAARPATCRS